MRETRSYGSVRGAISNERPYREWKTIAQWAQGATLAPGKK